MGVIVVASNKGGVGKTTIAILLSEELARRGYRVAVVEADEERHIANYLATRENNDVACNFTLTLQPLEKPSKQRRPTPTLLSLTCPVTAACRSQGPWRARTSC